MNDLWDAIVIGAGPAGMTAAATLSEGGSRTLVIDEQSTPGGQVYRAVERNADNAALLAVLGADYAGGAALTVRLRASAAELHFDTSAWRIDADGTVWIKADGKVEQLQARTLVIASGAMERPVPVPGWTLPGVMTIGALQIMLKDAGLRPPDALCWPAAVRSSTCSRSSASKPAFPTSSFSTLRSAPILSPRCGICRKPFSATVRVTFGRAWD
ncbi:FAD-dependent oxidoreductase [Mesorhizobium sp. B2-4-19]|uniref:FAD-dependent oxidoreductase n=1 Tax=Mesorhizobium sp. B2-4-19 TaxID=2589930 RepID=UPI001FEF8A79|nr:FAD-dependent oxidoreductase [Mesorhizobium sp. B2-4-19]